MAQVLTETQKKIIETCEAIQGILLTKNLRYGNSALEPIKCFYKGDNTNSILIRLDDKLSRIKNSEKLRFNDVCDLIGYLILYLVSQNIDQKEYEKLLD